MTSDGWGLPQLCICRHMSKRWGRRSYVCQFLFQSCVIVLFAASQNEASAYGIVERTKSADISIAEDVQISNISDQKQIASSVSDALPSVDQSSFLKHLPKIDRGAAMVHTLKKQISFTMGEGEHGAVTYAGLRNFDIDKGTFQLGQSAGCDPRGPVVSNPEANGRASEDDVKKERQKRRRLPPIAFIVAIVGGSFVSWLIVRWGTR